MDHPDHRHHPGHGRLEAELNAGLAGRVEQLVTELRDQLLVRSDHVPARPQRPQYVLPRRFGAADQLDDDLRGLEDGVEIALGAAQHTRDLGPPPGGGLDRVGALRKQPVECISDGAAAKEPDADRVGHSMSLPVRSSYVSRRTTARASPSLQNTTGGRGTPL